MDKVKKIEKMYMPNEILPLAILPRKLNKKVIKQSSKNRYIYVAKKLHKFYTDEDITDDDDIIKAINGLPFDYKKIVKQFPYLFNDRYLYDVIARFAAYVRELLAIFSRINGFTYFKRRLYPYVLFVNKLQQDKRDDKTIDDDIKNKLSFNHDDILSNVDKLKNDTDKLIYLLLTFIPPRRAHDYRHTKNISHIPDDTIDKDFNYYFDKHIYIYNTKNKKFYDLLLPDEIIPYINIETEFIFGNKLMKDSNLSKRIKDIFKKVYDYPYGATEIRRLYATYSNDNLTKKERKHNATAMGHSFEENINYSY
jgi:hypothetical protein